METRKSHMEKLNELLGQLLDLIGVDSHVATKIRSQVSDIYAMWNRLIIRNIENSTKVVYFFRSFKKEVFYKTSLNKLVHSTSISITFRYQTKILWTFFVDCYILFSISNIFSDSSKIRHYKERTVVYSRF